MTDFTTRPKSGAPLTVNIGSDVIQLMLSPVPASGWLPVYGLIQPIDVDVASLCAQPPAHAENWTWGDVLNALNPANHQFEIDKLLRMVLASIWPTYCEYVPEPGTDSPYTINGTLEFVDWVWSGNISGAYTGDHSVGMIEGGVDLWSVAITKCIQDKTTGGNPQLTVHKTNGTLEPIIANFFDSWAPPTLVLFGRDSLFRDPADESLVTMVPNDGYFYVRMHDTNGVWRMEIAGWRVVQTPPSTAPWPTAPAVPAPYQFSDECATAICAMAAAYPPPATDLTGLGDQLAAVLARLPTGRPPIQLGAPQFVFGDTTLTAPAGATGAYMALIVPAAHSKLATTPPIYIDAGWATPGTPGAWFEPHRLQHVDNLIYPLPPGSTKIAYTVTPGNIGIHTWLTEAPPP